MFGKRCARGHYTIHVVLLEFNGTLEIDSNSFYIYLENFVR